MHACRGASGWPIPGAEQQLCEVAGARAGEILRRARQLMTDRADDPALLMTLEMGKSLTESRAGEAARIDGRNPAGAGRTLVSKSPVGPCVLITPWNFRSCGGCPRRCPR